jgi:hypothetical protein
MIPSYLDKRKLKQYLCVLTFINFSVFSISMDNIIEPTKTFDFSKLSLAHPSGIQGGAYFTKIEYNKKPLYIQTGKSLTRQGFVKTGKKYYCDLMFDNNSEILINWFENLEEKCHKLIFEKKDDWFQGSLEENDIETAFNSIIRIYKSGKYYLARTHVKNSKDDLPTVKIYDENEKVMRINEITPETEIISILEIQGIKFTSRNFQIEIELKQIMVLNNGPTFESCLIKTNKPINTKLEDVEEPKFKIDDLKSLEVIKTIDLSKKTIELDNQEDTDFFNSLEEIDLSKELIKELPKELPIELPLEADTNININSLAELNSYKEEEKSTFDVNFETLMEEIPREEPLGLDINEPIITLKKPNQVYFELYKEARNKAKQAKKNAIMAYLEAKNIKKTYMIEKMDDSDSDFDDEIDEVSESELEGL